MAPPITPSSSRQASRDHPTTTPSRTPHTKHRLHFPNPKTPNANNNAVPTEHPVEVIGRIRNHPDRKDRQPPSSSSSSSLDISDDGRSIRMRTDIGYRDFTLDGVSISEDENLGGFYRRFVESRVRGVRLGAKCTVMMYGPTGSGKSHTMFGCSRQQGIVYRALRDILEEENKENGQSDDDAGFGVGLFVQVAVLEIYNEEIYDLLSGSSSGSAANVGGLPKGNVPKVRLEVMGKKAKNATYITGNDAGKISREVAKVEKRRIVKSTLCNERSSRSHCMIILDVPSVGGRLMLVDMAGSENLEQAGQAGFEAKMQTAKINQGNIALKRVVESIANGDSHVPFRDSKLTMLLQDSFEDDKSKILMILCASPDPKEMHKTISTFEYGAKAKCIVRVAHVATPRGGGGDAMNYDETSLAALGSRVAAMNQFIHRLQLENKQKEKERNDARKELCRKEEELVELRKKVSMASREEEERTIKLKLQLQEMEVKVAEQQRELLMLRQRLGEVEFQRENAGKEGKHNVSGYGLAKRLAGRDSSDVGDQMMEKSMEIDMGEQPTTIIHEIVVNNSIKSSRSPSSLPSTFEEEDSVVTTGVLPNRLCLSTVFEGGSEEEEEEVEKEVVEENKPQDHEDCSFEFAKDAVSRSTRIQNIFRLCGNYRELTMVEEENSPNTPPMEELKTNGESKRSSIPMSQAPSPLSGLDDPLNKSDDGGGGNRRRSSISTDKENSMPGDEGLLLDVFVKWETSKDITMSGNLIKKMKISKEASLLDLRKLVEAHLAQEKNNQQPPFTFLLLGDPTGAPVARDKEGSVKVSKLPICNTQMRGHLACLRPMKNGGQQLMKQQQQQQPNNTTNNHLPLGALENKLAKALCPSADDVSCFGEKESFSPKVGQNVGGYLSGVRT